MALKTNQTPFAFFFGDSLPSGESSRDLLGGKGDSLSAMTKAGLPVPPGFTLTTASCRAFYEGGESWPEGLDDEVRKNLQKLEERTGRQFGKGARPLFVSVRSGAAVSMPGMMDTLLNCGIHPGLAEEMGQDGPAFWHVFLQFLLSFSKTVHGLTEEQFPAGSADLEGASREKAEAAMNVFQERTGEAFPTDPWECLIACINAVYRSWNSERAIAYRKRNKVEGLVGTAVNVQAMFPSEVSGIVFTIDPNDVDSGRMVVESSYGLGEAVVSGEVTPDRFLVKRDEHTDFQTFGGKKTSAVAALGDGKAKVVDTSALTLDDAQVREIAALAMKVEEYFGHPVDIEWGYAEGKFSLLQSRAIRGLEVIRDAEKGRQAEIERLKKLTGGKEKVWVIHNLGETLRHPTPLTWDIVRNFMSGAGGFGLMYQDFGYAVSEQVQKEGFLELIAGRIYADPDRLSQLFWGGIPMGFDLEELRKDKSAMDRAPSKFFADKADETLLFRLPTAIKAMIKSSRKIKKLRKFAKEHFENEVVPPYLEYVKEKKAQNLSSLSEIELIRELKERIRRVLDEFGKESLKPPYFAGVSFSRLQGLLQKALGKEGVPLAATLTMGLDGDTTWEQDSLLYDVAQGKAKLEDFLESYGHRSSGEMELQEPRWREDPSYLETVLERIRENPGKTMKDIHEENHRKSLQAREDLPKRLAEAGSGFLLPDIEEQLEETRALLAYREKGKHYLMMGYELIRTCILELGERLGFGHDIFFLKLEEIETWSPGRRETLAQRVEDRKVRWQSFQRLELADVIDSRKLDQLGEPEILAGGDDWTGDSVSGGVARGRARIVYNPREAGDLGEGYVLVCPSTDPGWTPLFIGAKALIVEKGGVLSHGAIVARDFGIPAVVLPNATNLLQDGDEIRVDGNRGMVNRIQQEGENHA
ncbi:MAG: hypothetical protein JJT75_11495 [Opitutales bacterium]|nr:hypothetical protein [Opitutales bacterium]MCH8539206.1 hypothetical protein [Opitutales bacterium]